MSDALSDKIYQKKAILAETISKAPPSNVNFNDIIYFIPIQNNADDFDIENIIQQVVEIEKHPETPLNQEPREDGITPITLATAPQSLNILPASPVAQW